MPSRDNSTVAAADISVWELYLYDARDFSKPPETLPPFPEELRSGALILLDSSPEGRLLTGTAAGAVWVYSRDTRAYRRVADGAESWWLPDGRRLIFVRQGRLFVTDWLSGEPRQVFAIPGAAVSAPRLSPDGSFLYFLHGSASGDIWVVRFDETATDASKD